MGRHTVCLLPASNSPLPRPPTHTLRRVPERVAALSLREAGWAATDCEALSVPTSWEPGWVAGRARRRHTGGMVDGVCGYDWWYSTIRPGGLTDHQ